MKPVLIAASLLPLVACAESQAPAAGMPNPASAYCESLGGRSEIRQEAGGAVGYCHLPDGRVVEEWALFRAQGQG